MTPHAMRTVAWHVRRHVAEIDKLVATIPEDAGELFEYILSIDAPGDARRLAQSIVRASREMEAAAAAKARARSHAEGPE